MLDCRGKQLKAGDVVSVASSYGHTVGQLLYDPDDIRYKMLRIVEDDGYIRNKKKDSSRILNITTLLQEEVDRPVVRVLH